MYIMWCCEARTLDEMSTRCKAVLAVSKWRHPKQLFHNSQNHPRILSVLASSRSEESTRKGVETSFPRQRQAVDFQEIDALAAASGAAKALALGKKYSSCVSGASFSRFLYLAMLRVALRHCLWPALKPTAARAGPTAHGTLFTILCTAALTLPLFCTVFSCEGLCFLTWLIHWCLFVPQN
jgi:hypothetical protein